MDVWLPHKYIPRNYQIKFVKALESGIKRAVWVLHRRAGKDLTTWNWLIKECITRKINAYYILPTYSQAKKIIWDGITKDGIRFLDFIPKTIIKQLYNSELSVKFRNGSILQLVGSDNYDRLVGTNPSICVFSEFSLQNPTAWEYMRPILTENQGIAIFISTPRGKNHFYDLYEYAQKDKEWFCEKLTVKDTKVITENAIEKDRASGMSDEMIEQEYYCSFEIGQLGSIYGRSMQKAEEQNRIGYVPYDENLLVYTAWDLGFTDAMSIIFYQRRGNEVLIIDHYENNGYSLNHYLNILREKKYNYGEHFAPHDGKAHSSYGSTFVEVAAQGGFHFTIIENTTTLLDGIEKVRGIFPRFFIDRNKCNYLIKCLLEYHYEWDDNAKVFRNRPKHNWASHAADALRYAILSLEKGNFESEDMTLEEYRKKKKEYLGQ